MNEICQGGILPPLLFNVYFDEMIYKLEKSFICCKIGTHFIGADDVILLCPSRSGLQKMISICEQFGIDFQVTFNDTKTQYICFSKSNDTGYGPVTLTNKRLKWEPKVNHLGNILNQRMNDDDDLRKKKGHLIGSVNKMSNFANVQSVVLTTPFKPYCCSFMVVLYGN